MLSKNRRISKTEFKTFSRGKSFHSSIFSLFVYKKQEETLSQFSFICSKKVAKSAVKRNLLRRRGYNAVQKIIKDVKPGFYFVFNYKKEAVGATYKEINQEIDNLLQKTAVK